MRARIVALVVLAPVTALFLVVASLVVDRPVEGDRDAAWAEYGLPFSFARSEKTSWVGAAFEVGERATFNPWEDPTTGDWGRFAASWAVTTAALWLGIALVAARFARRPRPRLPP